ncbi:MAG: hypothetical protein Fur0032_18590 [Terrimicrobiaceae bacterium]
MSTEDFSCPKPPRALWPVFLGSLLGLALFLFGAKALLSIPGPVPPEDAARAAERAKAWADLQTENNAKLNTLAWADKAKGTVQLPIGLAMNLTVERLAGQTPRPVPTATPEPEPAPKSDQSDQSDQSVTTPPSSN